MNIIKKLLTKIGLIKPKQNILYIEDSITEPIKLINTSEKSKPFIFDFPINKNNKKFNRDWSSDIWKNRYKAEE